MNPTTTKINYVLYARKSSEEDSRQMLSLDSQESVLKEIAQRGGLNIISVLREARSAKAPYKRPVFSEMVKMINAGKVNGILCWKMDRLARNPVDEGQIKYLLQTNRIQKIKTPERDYMPEDNALIASVEFGMANQYIRDLSTNVKRGLYAKAERGLFPTFAPIGYLNNIHDPKGSKRIVKDPKRFALVRKMFDLILEKHYTPVQVWRIATKEWGLTTKKGKPLGRSTIYKVFTNPVYYGLFEYPANSGKWYKGKHQPMITAEEYDNVQIILGKKGKPRPHTHTFAFAGLMRCGNCGAFITAEEHTKHQKNGNTHHYVYYHCTKRINPKCPEKYIKEKDLSKQVLDILESINIPPQFHEWALSWLKKDITENALFKDRITTDKKKQITENQKQSAVLLNLLLKGTINEEDYKYKKAELAKENARLEIEPVKHADKIDILLNKATDYFDLCRDSKKEFEDGSIEKRRRIVSRLGSNPLLKDNLLQICIEKPLLVLKGVINEVRAIHSRFEPAKIAENSREIEQLYAQNLLVRGRGDLNP